MCRAASALADPTLVSDAARTESEARMQHLEENPALKDVLQRAELPPVIWGFMLFGMSDVRVLQVCVYTCCCTLRVCVE